VLLDDEEALDPIIKDSVGEPVAVTVKDVEGVCDGVTVLVGLGDSELLDNEEAPAAGDDVGVLDAVISGDSDDADVPLDIAVLVSLDTVVGVDEGSASDVHVEVLENV
jgi:hypothetical protein